MGAKKPGQLTWTRDKRYKSDQLLTRDHGWRNSVFQSCVVARSSRILKHAEKERVAEIRRWRADVSPTFNAVSMSLLQVLGHFWKTVFCSLTRSDFADRFDHHFFSFLLFFRLRNEDSCGTKSTVETKSLATGLENGKNRTEMSSSFWVRVRSRTNLFLVLLSGVSSERGKQASLVGLNFGVQPFSHFALAIFLPREIAVLFSFVGDFRELEQF